MKTLFHIGLFSFITLAAPSLSAAAEQSSRAAAAGVAAGAPVVASPAVASAINRTALPTTVVARSERDELEAADPVREARDRVFPALVNIRVVGTVHDDGIERKTLSIGSGTIISPEGYVLTNQHVTSGGRSFRCILADRQEIGADLVGEDPYTDLAILKLRLEELRTPADRLPVARFGDSDRVETGDPVLAMGSPMALSRSITRGVVSNPARVLLERMGDEDLEEMERGGQRAGLFTRWIQHDALIQPGSSGGPLVNVRGEIIGVNQLSGGSMGFAIPSNLAQRIASELISHGDVRRSTLDASLKPIARSGLESGVLVNSVVEGGAADKAGLQPGDVLQKIDGSEVSVRFIEELPPLLDRIANLPVGSTLRVTYRRGGRTVETRLVTGRLERDVGEKAALRTWGLTVVEPTAHLALEQGTAGKGAVVSGVKPGSAAALSEPALQPGDLIRSIGGRPIGRPEDLLQAYLARPAEDVSTPILVGFTRNGRDLVTLLKPKRERLEDPPREMPKAWIGVDTQPISAELATAMGAADARGFRISRIYPGTMAAKSALEVGDVIVSVNDQPLSPRGAEDAGGLTRLVRKLDPGESATLVVVRGNARNTVTVRLEPTPLPQAEARRDVQPDFELTVREITFFDRDEHGWGEELKGVLVSTVESAGWAGLGGLRPDDLIQRIDGQPITDLKSYRDALERVTRERAKRVSMVVLRGSRTQLQYLETEWSPETPGAKAADEKTPGTKARSETSLLERRSRR